MSKFKKLMISYPINSRKNLFLLSQLILKEKDRIAEFEVVFIHVSLRNPLSRDTKIGKKKRKVNIGNGNR